MLRISLDELKEKTDFDHMEILTNTELRNRYNEHLSAAWKKGRENREKDIDTYYRKKSKELVEQSAKINNLAYVATEDIHKATHWMALEDKDAVECEKVTPNQLYRLYLDSYEDEYILIDDEKNLHMDYICHEGQYVILEGSEKWMDYIKENL